MGQFTFHLLYMHARWIDREHGLAERLTVSVVLPSGVGRDGVEVDVDEDDIMLELECNWPSPLMNPSILFKAYFENRDLQRYTAELPEIGGFELKLKDLRLEMGRKRSENLVSKARIHLPFPVVKNKIEKILAPFKDDRPGPSACSVLICRFFKVRKKTMTMLLLTNVRRCWRCKILISSCNFFLKIKKFD